MAEGLTNALLGGRYEASSAGTEQTRVKPQAIEVLSELGIDISHHRSKTIDEFRGTQFDVVVTVCDNAKETCPFFPGKKVVHKSFADPSSADGSEEEKLEAFRQVRDEIKAWLLDTFSV
jgi:arsenate reductase